MSQKPHLLIVEDDPGIALALYKTLTANDYQVDTAKTGSSGLRKAAAKRFDLIMLDLGLPDMSGLTICRRLREDDITAPIIILTGENDVQSKVKLLDTGANDYVTKPFSMDELQARIRRLLREPEIPKQLVLTAGPLSLNRDDCTATRDGITVQLRRKECALLECLLQHAGQTVSRSQLMQYAWNDNEERWTNTVDVHIKHLRDKLDRPFAYPMIKTAHGLGYQLVIPSEVATIA